MLCSPGRAAPAAPPLATASALPANGAHAPPPVRQVKSQLTGTNARAVGTVTLQAFSASAAWMASNSPVRPRYRDSSRKLKRGGARASALALEVGEVAPEADIAAVLCVEIRLLRVPGRARTASRDQPAPLDPATSSLSISSICAGLTCGDGCAQWTPRASVSWAAAVRPTDWRDASRFSCRSSSVRFLSILAFRQSPRMSRERMIGVREAKACLQRRLVGAERAQLICPALRLLSRRLRKPLHKQVSVRHRRAVASDIVPRPPRKLLVHRVGVVMLAQRTSGSLLCVCVPFQRLPGLGGKHLACAWCGFYDSSQ